MSNHIPTEKARQQAIPGSDTFRSSHLLYHDPLNRDAGVIRLNVEAYKAFSDTILISQRHKLANERRDTMEWFAAGGFASNIPFPQSVTTSEYMEYLNYENLKIAAGFELHLKARLIAKDFVVHELDARNNEYKRLATKQATRPISKTELFAIRSFHFNGQQNYLPGLRDASLKFSRIMEEVEYRKALDLPINHLDIINDYRNLRNQIHLPGDYPESSNIQGYPGLIVDFIIDFINTEIVAYCNELIKKWQLNRNPLIPFS